ncbi:hypothetical protein [Dasania marina]|uniref:hypothetical protein n=1 Tax=Dasania marina TaxID=471499 RepID=UPI0030DB5106
MIKRIMLHIACAAALLGCASAERSVPDSAGGCAEPRPQICTREYRPVCGVQENSLAKSYGNACTACADVQVVYYLEGACKGRAPR